MSANTNNNSTAQPICQHKPGDVWEEGCCTSRKTSPQEHKPAEQTVAETQNSDPQT